MNGQYGWSMEVSLLKWCESDVSTTLYSYSHDSCFHQTDYIIRSISSLFFQDIFLQFGLWGLYIICEKLDTVIKTEI